MGDHTMDMLSAKANVPLHEQLYWTNFILNSTLPLPQKACQYSSLDMFPTLLESMGFSLENRAMGLGKSLYSNEPTLLERYGQKTLDSLLRERSIQYDYFLMGK
jgi:phosphoglycerol transferase